MAELLKGAAVVSAMTEKMKKDVALLAEKGITPTLAILRVGEREDDLSYERAAVKRCDAVGVSVKKVTLPADVNESTFFTALEDFNTDTNVHGILMFRPLPAQLDNEKARKMLACEKDVDGCTDLSLAGVFTNTKTGFAPCTAQAVIEVLMHYGVELSGKRAVVIGRSLVIGRPVAMMLMHGNATVTICHTRTKDVAEIAKEADILIACAGQMESVDGAYLREGQTVIDVGINWNAKKGTLCGDVKFEEAEKKVKAVTPVPGGVGAVTTCVLASHVIEAALRGCQ